MIFFYTNIKYLRELNGLTQVQLADNLEITRGNISNWERGKGMPSIEILFAMSVKFSVSIDDLLSVDLSDSKNVTPSKSKFPKFKNLLVQDTAEAGHIGTSMEDSAVYGYKNVIIPGVDYDSTTIKIQGDSMAPVLLHGDYVVGRKLDSIDHIRSNHIYIVNSRVGIYVKHVTRYESGLWLIPESKEYSTELIPYEEVISVWEVMVRITESLDNPMHHPNYLQLLADMNEMKELIRKLDKT